MHVPNWGDHMGMNDRFAILHPKSALLWKGRLQHTLSHCLEAPIHSETFVKHFSITNHLQVPISCCTCIVSSARAYITRLTTTYTFEVRYAASVATTEHTERSPRCW